MAIVAPAQMPNGTGPNHVVTGSGPHQPRPLTSDRRHPHVTFDGERTRAAAEGPPLGLVRSVTPQVSSEA